VERKVVFSPEAADDLINLYEYIAERSGPARAIGYIDRIEAYCAGFETSPSAVRDVTTCVPAFAPSDLSVA
jgi:plasmid stabilization system protein ParE